MVGVGFDFDSFQSLEEPAKREVKSVLGDVVDDWNMYDVGEIQRYEDYLKVELHYQDKSVMNRRAVTVEIDHNP